MLERLSWKLVTAIPLSPMLRTLLWIWPIRRWRAFHLPFFQQPGQWTSFQYVGKAWWFLRGHTELCNFFWLAWLVRYLPSWFPGAGFVKVAQSYKSEAESFSDVPYEFTKQQISDCHFVPSFLSNLLQNNPVESGTEEENIVKWSVGSLYAGGADTVRSNPSCAHHIRLTIMRLSHLLRVSFSQWPFSRRRNARLNRN